MKRILLAILLTNTLLLGACSKTEQTATTSASSSAKVEEKKEKDNELLIKVDGKEKSIPAKIEKDINDDIAEVKIPKYCEVSLHTAFEGAIEYDRMVVDIGNASYIARVFRGDIVVEQNIELDDFVRSFERMMPFTEPGDKEVPVNHLELKDYPELKGFTHFLKADGTDDKTYLLTKEVEQNGEKIVMEIKMNIPTKDDTEENVRTVLKSISTIKLK